MSYNPHTVKTAIRLLLEGIGEDLTRPDLVGTPERVARMFGKTLNGYDEDPNKHIVLFPTESTDEVLIKNIDFYSYCAHHLQPFSGQLSIGYIPYKGVLGLSKLVRIARVFARRLQLQENLVRQIGDYIYEHINCQGVAVHYEAIHSCMTVRGVRVHNPVTVTTHFNGIYNDIVLDEHKDASNFYTGRELRKLFLDNIKEK